jgi:hypothetical protein
MASSNVVLPLTYGPTRAAQRGADGAFLLNFLSRSFYFLMSPVAWECRRKSSKLPSERVESSAKRLVYLLHEGSLAREPVVVELAVIGKKLGVQPHLTGVPSWDEVLRLRRMTRRDWGQMRFIRRRRPLSGTSRAISGRGEPKGET